MKQVSFKIPAMQSAHCQANVRRAIQKYEGVDVINQYPGILHLSLPEIISEMEVVETIERAGYKVGDITPQDTIPSSATTFTYNTNINCSGCVSRITPHLDSLEGVRHWEVDTQSPHKTLKVTTEGTTSEKIVETVQKAGFRIN